ncbi:hypothetical protein [Marinobacter sp. BGYM27]|uniref:hypothetical protein n=1 Tax=unclassified Marinobacter TaxID=83889 RepID=UPI0021A59F1A|nr:hypothetical protein [Marinobacter sp. BGYM27]MDG5500146.1 hypothetical protein [Marinobacter sp. BGYM27]|tara:strand:- start:44557 stop:44850 length:294 start_codon:yes stop_codon:yes gene_type:complete
MDRLIPHNDVENGLADRHMPSPPLQPNLNQHDSVREHLQLRLNREVADLEERIESLRRSSAPHTAIIIATYERMIDRKKGFMSTWGMRDRYSANPSQ